MLTLWCDETNNHASERVQFFVYGGLVIPDASAPALHQAVKIARESHGFQAEDELKFQTNSRPKHVDQKTWNHAKGEVIEACKAAGCTLITVLVHHHVAESQKEQLVNWQLNTLLDTFNRKMLVQADSHGHVVMDRLGEGREYALIQKKFKHGGDGPWPRKFDRVLSYSSSCSGASHFSTAADVVLGSFAYCVNQRGDVHTPRMLMPQIWPLFLRGAGGDIWGEGIVLSPMTAKSPTMAKEYADLKVHITNLGSAKLRSA